MYYYCHGQMWYFLIVEERDPVSQLHLTSRVSSGYHSQSFIPHQRGFTILHASYSRVGKMPSSHTTSFSLTSLQYFFFVVMMIESAEFLSVFIAVIRSDVSTVPVTDQSMTYHNTMYYMYIVHTLRSTAYGGLRMTVFKKEREI